MHNVFHVSLLKGKIKTKYTAHSQLPDTNEYGMPKVYPVAVLATRQIKVRNRLEEEILVQWNNLLPGDATWERSKVIQIQFPDFTWSCGQDQSRGTQCHIRFTHRITVAN